MTSLFLYTLIIDDKISHTNTWLNTKDEDINILIIFITYYILHWYNSNNKNTSGIFYEPFLFYISDKSFFNNKSHTRLNK